MRGGRASAPPEDLGVITGGRPDVDTGPRLLWRAPVPRQSLGGGTCPMLLTGSQLRALDTLAASTASAQGAHGAVDENAYRILELDALASRDGDQGYSLTEAGRSAWQLVSEMRARGLLRPSDP